MGNLTGQSAVQALALSGVRQTGSSVPLTVTKTVNFTQAVGLWTPPGQTSQAYNYQQPQAAALSQVAGDVLWLMAPAGTTTSPASPYVYTLASNAPVINFKGCANGTSGSPVTWLIDAVYLRLTNPSLRGNTTGYSAGTTDWPVGEGLIHFEGNQYILLDFRDTSGVAPAMELGNPSEYNPTIGAGGNWGTSCYSHWQTFSAVSSNFCAIRGIVFHGANQYLACYGGSDCTGWWFDHCVTAKHGVNYGGGANNNPPGIAYGNVFDWHGSHTLFTNCSATLSGHGQGFADWGHHNVFQNCDYSGDWTTYQAVTGKPSTYASYNGAGSLDQALPTITSPYAATTQCGPSLHENCRFAKAGPGDLPNGTPLVEVFGWNAIFWQSIFVDQLAKGHNMIAATVAMAGDSHLVNVCASLRVFNCSGYGVAGLLDEQDTQITGAANSSLYSDHRFLNNALGNAVDSNAPPGPVGYWVRSIQGTANAGSSATINKSCYFVNNLVNAPASSTTDGQSPVAHVMSRTMWFSAYGAGAAFCDWTDAGNAGTSGASTVFPGYMSGNVYNANMAFVNVANREAALPIALAGMKLDPNNPNNTVGIGDAAPVATVTANVTGGTSVHLSDALWMCDGFGAGVGAPGAPVVPGVYFAIKHAGTWSIYQLATYTGATSDTNRVAGIAVLSTGTVTASIGDIVAPVLRDGVTICLNRGLN